MPSPRSTSGRRPGIGWRSGSTPSGLKSPGPGGGTRPVVDTSLPWRRPGGTTKWTAVRRASRRSGGTPTDKREDIIYVLIKEDVRIAAKGLGIRKLTDEHYRTAQKYFEGFCSNGVYTWVDAIVDGLRAVEDERRRSRSGIVRLSG